MTSDSKLTDLIHGWQSGDKQAENLLYRSAYLQLRKIARKERERCANKYGDTNIEMLDRACSTTILIHESYVKISSSKTSHIQNQREYYLMVTQVMRQILIDNARANQAKKRQKTKDWSCTKESDTEQLIELNKALDCFSELYPRQSKALTLKYLIGLKNQEISELLECSNSLIEKDLKFSRSWLQSKLTTV
ncbi:ECF-type sigma factor [Vibrio japonicus]|uniref:ECF-type sigma factor n=1 Tax=Vibrio japonicus TaxID=1824638 RepID=A0ABY5LHU9_9VIBR|nr:ECF-type sigma factor [Vibrio japonicus]UUM30672.1 ECF-type sigma factor [Vibrio japonicus]